MLSLLKHVFGVYFNDYYYIWECNSSKMKKYNWDANLLVFERSGVRIDLNYQYII